MNYAIVLRLLSFILYCEAALLLLPAMASQQSAVVAKPSRI